MNMTKVGDLMAALGKYNDSISGEEKTRWGRAGALLQRPDSSFVVKIDMMPVGGTGWLNVFTEQTAKKAATSPPKSAPARVESPSPEARPAPSAQESDPRAPDLQHDDIPF